jgi:hypothetical protein
MLVAIDQDQLGMFGGKRRYDEMDSGRGRCHDLDLRQKMDCKQEELRCQQRVRDRERERERASLSQQRQEEDRHCQEIQRQPDLLPNQRGRDLGHGAGKPQGPRGAILLLDAFVVSDPRVVECKN